MARYKLLHWLSHPQRSTSMHIVRWLLIFDNMDNPNALRDYLPSNGPGSILITSREPRFQITHLRPGFFKLMDSRWTNRWTFCVETHEDYKRKPTEWKQKL
jgi:hypothetical protein